MTFLLLLHYAVHNAVLGGETFCFREKRLNMSEKKAYAGS